MKIPKIPFITSKASLLGSFDNRSGLPVKEGNGYWYSQDFLDSMGANRQQMRDFLEVPELNAVINIKARAEASGIIDAYNKESGKPQSSNTSLVRVLRTPNWFQGSLEFWRQSCLWRSIFGNEYIYFLTPEGMPNSYMGMFTLNPANVTIKYKPQGLYFMQDKPEGVEYIYTENGREYPLDSESIIHLNDNRVEPTNILLGTSKIDSLQGPIQNIRAAYRKRNIALNIPIGIFSNDQKDATGGAIPLDDDDKEEAIVAMKQRKGLPIFTNLPVTYEALTVNAKNMGLFEETREDTMRICDAYGVPYDLVAGEKGNALSDGGRAIKESMKQMYENTTIPDMNEKTGALNNRIGTETMAWEVRAKFNHLPVFAEDKKQFAISMKQLVEALSKALADEAITIEQYQEALIKYGLPKPEDK